MSRKTHHIGPHEGLRKLTVLVLMKLTILVLVGVWRALYSKSMGGTVLGLAGVMGATAFGLAGVVESAVLEDSGELAVLSLAGVMRALR